MAYRSEPLLQFVHRIRHYGEYVSSGDYHLRDGYRIAQEHCLCIVLLISSPLSILILYKCLAYRQILLYLMYHISVITVRMYLYVYIVKYIYK